MKYVINIGKVRNRKVFWKGKSDKHSGTTKDKNAALGFKTIEGARAELPNISGVNSDYRLIMAVN